MLWYSLANQCYEPLLHAISVESLDECVLVLEDNPSIREYAKNELECTLVLPREEYWLETIFKKQIMCILEICVISYLK